MSKDISVIFSFGPSFHGATLLSLILGNHSQIAALGDTLPSKKFDQICGCGEKVSNCKFWEGLIKKIKEGMNYLIIEFPSIFPYNLKVNAALVFVLGLFLNKAGIVYKGSFSRQYKEFFEYVTRYYDKKILLDGAKSLCRYLFVKGSDCRVVGTIHLTRDPRAFVASSISNSNMTINDAIFQYNMYHITLLMINYLIPSAPYIRIKYENLTDYPNLVIKNILKELKLNDEELLQPIEKNVHWMGNSSLFYFTGEVYHNEKWRHALDLEQQSYVLHKTAFLCRKFGYNLNP